MAIRSDPQHFQAVYMDLTQVVTGHILELFILIAILNAIKASDALTYCFIEPT
jgi:hypothetical protein